MPTAYYEDLCEDGSVDDANTANQVPSTVKVGVTRGETHEAYKGTLRLGPFRHHPKSPREAGVTTRVHQDQEISLA